jgi:hypothetical protein
MSSEVELCNLALSNIRAGSINSLTEASIQAQQCKLKYPFVRNRMLADTVWGFNHKVKALALSIEDIPQWGYAYKYPVDCLKVNRLIPSYERVGTGFSNSYLRSSSLITPPDIRRSVEFEVFNFSDSKLIGSNDPDLYIDYAAEITDPNLFSDDFIMALSHLLASELAVPLVGAETGRQLRSDSLQIYKEYMNSATANDANDEFVERGESEFESVRR